MKFREKSSEEVEELDTNDRTVRFNREEDSSDPKAEEVLLSVNEALEEKGYNPINQIVGYLLSGDPAYIPRHKEARTIIRQLERDELIEELIRHYLRDHQSSS